MLLYIQPHVKHTHQHRTVMTNLKGYWTIIAPLNHLFVKIVYFQNQLFII